MDKETRRMLELAGVKPAHNETIKDLYENYSTSLDASEEDMPPPIKGLEGPFKMRNGRIVYYDPKEGKYYDRFTDLYLDDEETAKLHEDNIFVGINTVLARVTENDRNPLQVKVDNDDGVKTIVEALSQSGKYNVFEFTNKVDERKTIDPENLNESYIVEKELSKEEEKHLDKLKKKYEDSEMYDNMIDQYGKEKGENVFYAKLTQWAKEGKGLDESLEEAKKDQTDDWEDATVFDNIEGHLNYGAVDDKTAKDERTGRLQRTTDKVEVPKEVMDSINNRIKELEKSIKRYDRKGYDEKSVKPKAIEALNKIKDHLKQGDLEGIMHAQVYFGTLMSPIWDMIPAKVVNFVTTMDVPEDLDITNDVSAYSDYVDQND